MAKIQLTFTLEDVNLDVDMLDTTKPIDIQAADDAKNILASNEGWQIFGEMDPRFMGSVITNVTAEVIKD